MTVGMFLIQVIPQCCCHQLHVEQKHFNHTLTANTAFTDTALTNKPTVNSTHYIVLCQHDIKFMFSASLRMVRQSAILIFRPNKKWLNIIKEDFYSADNSI